MRKAPNVSRQLFVLAALLLWLSGTAHAETPLYSQAMDRFGVDVRPGFGQIIDYSASPHIARYSDWTASVNPPRSEGTEYAQLLWVVDGVDPSPEEVGPLVDANPGSLWMIGNEPECIWQGNNTPEQYADAYHQLHTLRSAIQLLR